MSFLGGVGGGPVLGDGLIRIGAVTNGLRGAVRNAVNDARAELNAGAAKVQGQSAAWGKAFGVIGAAAKIGFAGLTIGLLGAIGASVEFEKNWAGVRKTVDATPERLEKLRAEFRALAKEIPVSVNELAHIGETAGALGVATDSITAFTKVTAELGSTTNVSSDQAATALGQLSNVLKLTEKDYERFGSTLVDLGNKGASTESQILDIASRSGAAAKLIGMSTPALLAWGSAVASLGIETEAGGSALQFFYLQASKVINEVSKKGPPSARALAEAQAKVAIATERLTKAEKKHGKSSMEAKQASLSLAKAQDALGAMTHGTAVELETLAKTAGMTVDQFKALYAKDASAALAAFITGLGKLPAGAQQGVLAIEKLNNIRVVRAMLGLANNAGELNRQLGVGAKAWEENTALANAAGKRYETTAAQLSILKNTIQDLFISVGDNALPVVKWLVHAFREDIPKAATFLSGVVQNVWTHGLGAAVGGMVDALGRLGGAIASVFDFGGGKESNGIATILDGLGAAAGQAAKFVGILASVFATLLSNPIINGLAHLAVLLGAISLALSGGAAVVGKLSSGVAGIARRLSFGRLGGTGAPEKTPLDASAKKLDGSATALKEAAGALKGASVAGKGAAAADALSHATPIQYLKDPANFTRTPSGGTAFNETGKLVAVGTSDIEKKAYLQSKAKWDAAGGNIFTRTVGGVTDGVTKAATGIRKVAGSVMSGVGKLFWPAIIADLGIEFIKEPLGTFISKNTGFKRVGEQMKSDFFGGLISLVQSWSIGSDAFVGHNATMTIGKMTFKTMSLAKLGVSSATFDKLEAPEGTIEHAQGVSATEATLAATNFARAAGEDINDWWKRVRDALPEETQKAAQKFIIQNGRGAGYVKDAAGLEALIRQATSKQLADLSAEAKTAYVDALTDALKAQGFTSGQIASLTTAQLATLGNVVQKDAEGKYGFITEFLTNSYIGAISSKTPTQVSLASDQKARVAALAKQFGAKWETTLGAIDTGKSKPSKAVVTKLKAALGDDWKTLLHDTFEGLDVHLSRGGGGDHPTALGGLLAGLKSLQGRATAAMTAFLKNVPVEYQQALADFVAQTKTVDPTIVATLKKRFGDDWLTAMRNGTAAITSKPVDKPIVAEMVKRFGPNWRAALQGFGQLLFEQQGGADTATLKATLAKALGSVIASLTPADLTPTGAKPESKGDAAKDRAAIQKYISSTVGQAALAAAAGPDATASKKGFEDLGTALKNAIPDPAKRQQFIGTLVALQKATELPNLPGLQSFLASAVPRAADALGTMAGSISNLADVVVRFLRVTGLGSPAPTTGQRSSAKKGASGMVFDTGGETHLTVGEAGREHVAVLRNFKTIKLPKLPIAASLTHDIVRGLGRAGMPSGDPVAQYAGHTGPRVQVTADKLQLFSDGDRRSMDAQLAFLAPDGR